MTKVTAPDKNYTGVTATVYFKDGVGETDKDYLLNWFQNHGYTVETGEEKTEETGAEKTEEAE
jgi:hypothetical protein